MKERPILFGPLKLDPTALGSQGNAILGIRDSGKTYTATVLAERLFDAGVPFVAFDPIGVWRFLRVPGNGRGYPVVVAGGQEGDLPLTVTGAPEIVRAAMANGVSLVIDLFDINLSKADWKRIVTACVRVLLHENQQHGLRHVFIEEAAEFAPQRIGPDQGAVYAEIEKLARMGGNARLGYTLINQRAEEVNKAVLELCDNLFLHRQKGRNSLTALSKWLDIGNVAQAKAIIASLPTLPTGECWAWMQGSEVPARIKVPAKASFHPDRRVMRGDDKQVTRQAVDVGSFVATMRGTLQDVEREARTVDELKADNAKLRRELTAAKRANVTPEVQGLADCMAMVRDECVKAGVFPKSLAPMFYPEAIIALHLNASARNTSVGHEALSSIVRIANDALAASHPTPQGAVDPRARATAAHGKAMQSPTPRSFAGLEKREEVIAKPGTLSKGERAVLVACAQHQPNGCTREQLSILTGYKRSTRDAYIQRLREKNLLLLVDNQVMATPAAVTTLGDDFEPLPTGASLRQHWLERLPRGERLILEVLCERYPDPVQRDAISEYTGFARSSRDAYLQRLSARQLVKTDRGTATASPFLFDG